MSAQSSSSPFSPEIFSPPLTSPTLPHSFSPLLQTYLQFFPQNEQQFWKQYFYLILNGWNEECGEEQRANGGVLEVLLFKLYQALEPTSTTLPSFIPRLLAQARTQLLHYSTPYPSSALDDGTVVLHEYVEWVVETEMTQLYRQKYEEITQQQISILSPTWSQTSSSPSPVPVQSPVTLTTIVEEPESAYNSAASTPHHSQFLSPNSYSFCNKVSRASFSFCNSNSENCFSFCCFHC